MRSLEYRNKMSQIAKNNNYGKWMIGKTASPESREKAARWFRGDKHWGWKGGDWRYVKKQALIRDDYTCQMCSFREVEIMEVDHILSKSLHPELSLDLENLMTLCPNCHRRKTIRDIKNKAIKFRSTKSLLEG